MGISGTLMEILKADLPLTCFIDNDSGAQVRLCMGVCNSNAIHMQGEWIPDKGRKSCVWVCYENLHVQKLVWLSMLHLSFKTILHFINCQVQINIFQEVIKGWLHRSGFILTMSRKYWFNFFQATRIIYNTHYTTSGFHFWASKPKMAKNVLLPLNTKYSHLQ